MCSSDLRSIRTGDLFVALSGKNFDGHRFVEDAIRKGAIGAIFSQRPMLNTHGKRVMVRVKDTTRALQQIAAYHRSLINIPVIAVTGSNGKTTVKDMISAVLTQGYSVLKTEGTKNNHIGVPQTLLKLNSTHQICVIELGTNHRGEIRLLGDIARPTVAVITNIGPSHLEFLQDLEGVFTEKMDILKTLDKDMGAAIVNGDDPYLVRVPRASRRVFTYGLGDSNDIYAVKVRGAEKNISFTVNGSQKFEVGLIGTHNVYNALAAVATGTLFGVSYKDIRKALSGFRAANMRLAPVRVRGIDVINDSYNSNPLSMSAAIEALVNYPASSRWIVTGDMLELGKKAVLFHRKAGEEIARAGAGGLLTLGELSKFTLSQARASGLSRNKSWHCASHGEAAAILKSHVKRGDVILIKGSRAMTMEKILEKL